MSWSSDPTARLQGAREALDAREIDYSKPVKAAFGLVDQIADRRPIEPDAHSSVDAYLSGATDTAALQTIVREHFQIQLSSAHRGALETASRRALNALLNAGDELVEQLRPRAEAQIDAIQRVADLNETDLHKLLAAGRTEDATAVAGLAAASTELLQLYDLRDAYLWPRDAANINGTDCSRWTDPTPVDHHLAETPHHLDNVFLMGSRHGARLWWPSLGQAVEEAQPIAAQRGIELEQQRLIRRGQGHVSAAVMV
ncbi:hypothetical protein NM962_12605 [Mycobacterium sp. SVM_VP21]|nr:hypothetical protein NM962_12605 [Mycobacterium sp. SVM_VP21]